MSAKPEIEAEGEQEEEFVFEKKKKKKEKKKPQEEQGEVDGTGEVFVKSATYEYVDLLERVQELIQNHNPDLQGTKRYTLKPPKVSRVGSKKVAWINFTEICTIMDRNPEHVLQFVLAEQAVEGSIAGNGQLVLKGKFTNKDIESLLKKYIREYVACSMCKSPNTTLGRDNRTRLFNINCHACGANRSVTTIKSGFHAVSKQDRLKAKLAV